MAIADCNTVTDKSGREVKEHGTALFPAACYYDDLAEMPVPWHWHEELEAALVTEGRAAFVTESERVELAAGEGCIINAEVLHAAWREGEGPCRLHSIVFHPRLVGGSAESVFWHKYIVPITENRSFGLVALRPENGEEAAELKNIELAWRACAEEPEGYEFTARNALSRLVLFLRGRLPDNAKPVSAKRRRDEARIKAMLSYIRAHLADEVDISSIAAAAMVSESECIRCFKNTIGVTPIRYAKELRLQKAAELISGSDMKITEIGEACGFQEMSYFARAFRERYGASPSEYRSARKR